MTTTDYMMEMSKVIRNIKLARVVTNLIFHVIFAVVLPSMIPIVCHRPELYPDYRMQPFPRLCPIVVLSFGVGIQGSEVMKPILSAQRLQMQA